MANEKHLELARKGREAWNDWRAKNPDEPADFSGTDFTLPENKDINFAGFKFGDKSKFNQARFGDIPSELFLDHLHGLQSGTISPEGGAVFFGASFGYVANFSGATFGYLANFSGAAFGDGANFSGAAFGDEADFSGTAFGSQAKFLGAIFGDWARFLGATFGDWADFSGAALGDQANFSGTAFGNWANFSGMNEVEASKLREGTRKILEDGLGQKLANAWFERLPPLENHWHFGNISFARATFKGDVNFRGRKLTGQADLSRARFHQPPDFQDIEGKEWLDLTGVKIGIRGPLSRILITEWTADSRKISAIRRLRKLAAEINHHDLERDLFILERRAERGELWSYAGWKFWRYWTPFSQTMLVWLYSLSSDFGRSVVRPVIWFCALQVGLYYWYAGKAVQQPSGWIPDPELLDFTLAQGFPYLPTLRMSSEKVAELFGDDLGFVQAMVVPHGLLSALFVFLALLAVRNFFKVK